MKTRVEKFLVHLEMAEPSGEQPYQEGTVWINHQRWLDLMESCARIWGAALTAGPEPRVTITREQ